MSREVAYHLLVAQAEAWPLSAEVAFERATVALRRHRPGVLDDDTQHIAERFDCWLRPRVAGMSLDSIRRLREAVWFQAPPAIWPRPPASLRSVPLADFAAAVGGRYLERHDAGCCLKVGPDCDRAERAARWRWISLCLPQDFLVAAACSRPGLLAPGLSADSVDLRSPQLSSVLERPVAQTHLHMGAAFDFSRLWTALLSELSVEAPDPQRLEEGGPPPFGSGRRCLELLAAAALTRLVLAAFLWKGAAAGCPRASLAEWAGPSGGLWGMAVRCGWPGGDSAAQEALRAALALVWGAAASGPAPLARWLRLYAFLSACRRRRKAQGPTDPLEDWPALRGAGAAETRFSILALSYLRSAAGRSDANFGRLYWQYQRVRNSLFRHVVQEPGTGGLDWFTRHYSHLKPFRPRVLDERLAVEALALESAGLNLASLELRTSPDPAWHTVRALVRLVAAQAAAHVPPPGSTHPEIGLVLHFIKAPWRGRGARRRLEASPDQPVFGARYGAWSWSRRREASAVRVALERDPRLLLVLRGLDVAAAELAVPTWPLIPILRELRCASRQAAARLPVLAERVAFRQTLHAGEDFRRLSEGLRRIHEPLAFGLLEPGDRIGHGLALGVDPARWAAQNLVVLQPREERLDDLLWELDLQAKGALFGDVARLELVRAQTIELARQIYGAEDVDGLVRARRLRHLPEALAALGYPASLRDPGRSDESLRFLYRYLTDLDVFEAGYEAVPVESHPSEVAVLAAMQRHLGAALGRQEITIETNPSSNLLIGDLLRAEDHPLFRLQPLPGSAAAVGPVQVSINDDDPATFATRLADEYAYLHAALLRMNVPAQEALASIDRLRENGWQSRFTLKISSDPACLRTLTFSGRGLPRANCRRQTA